MNGRGESIVKLHLIPSCRDYRRRYCPNLRNRDDARVAPAVKIILFTSRRDVLNYTFVRWVDILTRLSA